MHRANLKHSVSVKYCGKASLVYRRFGISVDNAASVDRYPRTKRVRRVDWRSAIFDVGKIPLESQWLPSTCTTHFSTLYFWQLILLATSRTGKRFFSHRVAFWHPKICPQFTRLSLKGILRIMTIKPRKGGWLVRFDRQSAECLGSLMTEMPYKKTVNICGWPWAVRDMRPQAWDVRLIGTVKELGKS